MLCNDSLAHHVHAVSPIASFFPLLEEGGGLGGDVRFIDGAHLGFQLLAGVEWQ